MLGGIASLYVMFKSGSPPGKHKATMDSQFDVLPLNLMLTLNDMMTSRINPLGIAGSLYYI